jgi:hypothetical protein
MLASLRVRLAAVLLLASALPAYAGWPNQPAVNLPVCTGNASQNPTIVADGLGGAIITWFDYRDGSAMIYAQHVLASGTVDPAWPVNGRAVFAGAGPGLYPVIVSDAAGGAIIASEDYRGGAPDIYAQHVLATGALDPAWPVGGRALCTAVNDQMNTRLVGDGAGGAIACWKDKRSGTFNVYAQHVRAGGTVDPAWPVDGRAVCTAVGGQQDIAAAADGAGGLLLAWADYRTFVDYDVYVHHVLASGAVDPSWPANGRLAGGALDFQDYPCIVSDGVGGALVAWMDFRSGTWHIYAQHVRASGTVDPGWAVNGRPLCLAPNSQYYPSATTDGGGGMIVSWGDTRAGGFDVYAQRVLPSSALAPGWATDGQPVCTAIGDQGYPITVPDGTGGALIAWIDSRVGTFYDAYAQHLLGSGTPDPAWTPDGVALSSATGRQDMVMFASDGAGGGIATWQDNRANGAYDIYAQRVARFGLLGSPDVDMAAVKDVLNDQGGKVKVSWNASYLESDPFDYYLYYYLFRSVPAGLAAGRAARAAHAPNDASLAPGDLVATSDGTTTLYWELLTALSSLNVPGYSYVAPTTGDSVAGSNPLTSFMVQVRWGGPYGTQYWNSVPAAGYSVDNLAPLAPAPFTGTYAGGTTYLHWDPNAEADLAGYRLYRGSSAGFVPGPGNLVAAVPDTGHADAGGAPLFYKLTAVDVHGNESPAALLTPSGTLAVEGAGPPRELAFSPPSPNPTGTPTTLRYALPRAARVRLAIYDAAGRLVRVLAEGERPAGEHAARWDLRDAAGRAASAGLYFARFESEGRTFVRRVAVTP